jgi:hypothetical protein
MGKRHLFKASFSKEKNKSPAKERVPRTSTEEE